MKQTIRSAFGCTLMIAILSGCGGSSDAPETGDVTGKVTLDGEPAAGVNVLFQPEEGRPSTAVTDEDGNYTLKYVEEEGAVIGKHTVKISTPQPEQGDPDDCSQVPEDAAPFVDPIPPKYNSKAAQNPDMKVEVKAGPNEFNFDLESDPTASRNAAANRGGGGGDPCTCGVY